MSRVTWDQIGEKTYETGASNGSVFIRRTKKVSIQKEKLGTDLRE